MSDFTFFDKTLGSEPVNLIISTPPGRGTVNMLLRELADAGSWTFFMRGTDSGVDLRLPTADGAPLFTEDLEMADTIIIDDASKMVGELAELAEELLKERSTHGKVLKLLKNVVLVYTRVEDLADPLSVDQHSADPYRVTIDSRYATTLVVR